nr:uncharacterized protein LOC113817666 [Penaeus vannamei]
MSLKNKFITCCQAYTQPIPAIAADSFLIPLRDAKSTRTPPPRRYILRDAAPTEGYLESPEISYDDAATSPEDILRDEPPPRRISSAPALRRISSRRAGNPPRRISYETPAQKDILRDAATRRIILRTPPPRRISYETRHQKDILRDAAAQKDIPRRRRPEGISYETPPPRRISYETRRPEGYPTPATLRRRRHQKDILRHQKDILRDADPEDILRDAAPQKDILTRRGRTSYARRRHSEGYPTRRRHPEGYPTRRRHPEGYLSRGSSSNLEKMSGAKLVNRIAILLKYNTDEHQRFPNESL